MQADEVARFQDLFERQQANVLFGGERGGHVGIGMRRLSFSEPVRAGERDFGADRA